jgi:uncharacterized protein (TIGR00661 family)
MRFLYAVNGTGYGHVSRAKLLIAELKKHGSVELLVSCEDRPLDFGHEVTYRFPGFHFEFSNGRVDVFKCIRNNSIVGFVKDMRSLDLRQYDYVISDFEPMSCWRSKIQQTNNLTQISNQAAFQHSELPRYKKKNFIFETFTRNFCPAKNNIAIHYDRYNDKIYYPLLNPEIINATGLIESKEACTVYLSIWPKQQIINLLGKLPNICFDVFLPGINTLEICGNITFYPIDQQNYRAHLLKNKALLTTAGFEATSEAMYLGKMVMTFPIPNHYEQYCNATALENFGVQVAWPEELTTNAMQVQAIYDWWERGVVIHRPVYTVAEELISNVINR